MGGLKFIKKLTQCIGILVSLTVISPSAAGIAASDGSPPSYNASRYLEDYRYLKDPSMRTDFWDRLKYIPFNDSGTTYLSFGGETRQHFESIRNENWGATVEDNNGWYLQRYLLHADLHIGDRLRLFSQVQSGIETGRSGGPRGVDEDRLDLHQLFLDFSPLPLKNKNLTIRVGRQEIIFGSRRFLNYRERPNLRLSHDAVMGMVKLGRTDVTAFAARPVQIDRDYFDNNSGNEHSLWGLYTVTDLGWAVPQKLDVYYIGLNREQARFDQGRANEVRQSLGTRLWGKYGALDYNFEFMYQFGSFGDATISAYALASDTGYTWKLGADSKIRFSLRADIYNGDDDPNDADLNAFNPFFPKGKHISQLAATGLINQRDLHPKMNIQFNKHWFLTLSTEFIWRDSLDDGIYSIANGLLKTGQASRARYVGTQPEVELKWQVDRHLDIKGIFVFFDAGPFIKDNPPGNDIIYLGTMATYRF
ncbi:MAG: alginate export family protein [Nitrospinota bacterium]|nr:alginate export family protein [Nitrospinota bacterium]